MYRPPTTLYNPPRPAPFQGTPGALHAIHGAARGGLSPTAIRRSSIRQPLRKSNIRAKWRAGIKGQGLDHQ